MIDEQRQRIIGLFKGLGWEQTDIEWFTGPYKDFPEDKPDKIKPINPNKPDVGNAPGTSTQPLTVTFTPTHVLFKASEDIEFNIGGDVRDATVKLKAGSSSQRKLTKEGNGFVNTQLINGGKETKHQYS